MSLWLPKVRVHESETRGGGCQPLWKRGKTNSAGIMGSSWKKEGGDREEEEKTDVQAARDNPRKRARPILNLQEQLILGLSTVPGGTTCPSIYVPYSR